MKTSGVDRDLIHGRAVAGTGILPFVWPCIFVSITWSWMFNKNSALGTLRPLTYLLLAVVAISIGITSIVSYPIWVSVAVSCLIAPFVVWLLLKASIVDRLREE